MIIFLKDMEKKADWYFGKSNVLNLARIFFTDGTAETLIYRLMWLSNRWHLTPFTYFFAWVNAFFNKVVIGRRADFGPGFVILHGCGTVINSSVRGGANIIIENGITIGAEKNEKPELGNNIFIGAGARIIGKVKIGDNVKIGANAVVAKNIPNNCTVVGIPARIVKLHGKRVDLPL